MLKQIADMRLRSILMGALFVLIVLTTNHIIIYNEEIVIALSFFGFVYFTREYFGSSIRSTFENRRSTLFHELSGVLEQKEAYVSEILQKEKRKAERKHHVRHLVVLTRSEILNFSTTCENQLPKVINENVYRRLDRLRLAVSNQLQQDIQSYICDTNSLRSQVIYHLYCVTGRRKQTQKQLITRLYKQAVN